MITDEDVEQALDVMRKYAGKYAEACGNVTQLEGEAKIIEATQMLKHDGAVEIRRAKARASEFFQVNNDGLAAAVEKKEFYRHKLNAAQAICDIYRTQQASNRKGY